MLKKSLTMVACICLCLVSFGAMADEDVTSRDRYVLSDTGDGWLRLDRSNGRVSLCEEKNGRIVCLPVPDAAIAYEREIERLLEENAALEMRVAELEADLAELAPSGSEKAPDTKQPQTSDKSLGEDEEEFEQMMDFTERAMRRFFGMVRTLQDEFDERT